MSITHLSSRKLFLFSSLHYPFPVLEQVVVNEPLVPPVEPEELRARHEERPPPRPPNFPVVLPVNFPQHLGQRSAVCVHVLEPRLGREGVVITVHGPVRLQGQVALEVEEEGGGGHGAA